MTRITLENVTHYYGKELALENVSISFEANISSALLGPSGCGKTTILKIICGLLKPTQGKVYFDDEDVTDVPPEERNVAIVFQFPVVYPMSVERNLLFPLLRMKLPKDEIGRRVNQVSELLGIKHLLQKDARSLGPADRQRVALARAIIREPRLFLFDEPMSSIEPEKRVILKSELKKLVKELKKTSIFVTHDQSEAITFAEKIAVMTKARIVQYGTYEEIYDKPLNDFVAFFIGYPGMNILLGKVMNGRLYIDRYEVRLAEQYAMIPEGMSQVKIGIRPEHILISFQEKPNWLPVTVEALEDLGNGVGIVETRLNDVILKIKVSSSQIVEGMKRAWIYLPPDKIHLFSLSGERITL